MPHNAKVHSEPAVEAGKITLGQILTFSDYLPGVDSSSKPVAKRAKRDGGGSIASDKSSRVRFRLPPRSGSYFSRIPLTIARASR